jgi:hypothetical protein
VIGQTLETHLLISQLLVDLRATPPSLSFEKRIEKALSGATTLKFIETPLNDVVGYLADLHGIEIQIDNKALKEAGSSASTAITLSASNVKLRTALWLMLQPLNLAYVINEEVLLITTEEKAAKLNAKLYPVAVPAPRVRRGGRGGQAPQPAATDATGQTAPTGGGGGGMF